MTKHVFEVTSYGSVWYRGKYAGETEKMFNVARVRFGREDLMRVNKKGCHVIECDDPKEAEARYGAARKSFDEQIAAIERELSALCAMRRETAIAALKGEA